MLKHQSPSTCTQMLAPVLSSMLRRTCLWCSPRYSHPTRRTCWPRQKWRCYLGSLVGHPVEQLSLADEWMARSPFLLPLRFHQRGLLSWWLLRTKQFPEHRIVMRSLAHVVQGRHGLPRLHWYHVKAHKGDPWNELADTVARHASVHPEQTGNSDLWLPWHHDPDHLRPLQWIWYLQQMMTSSPYTPSFKDGHLVCTIPQVPETFDQQARPDLLQDRFSSIASPASTTINIVIATANVLTLHPSASTRHETSISRQCLLMQQFHDAGCLLGVQETRRKHLVGVNNAWYHIIGHPATPQGVDGVQLWMSNCISPSDNGPPIAKDNIRLVASAPNYLVSRSRLTLGDAWSLQAERHILEPRHSGKLYRMSFVEKQLIGHWFSAGTPMPILVIAPPQQLGRSSHQWKSSYWHIYIYTHNISIWIIPSQILGWSMDTNGAPPSPLAFALGIAPKELCSLRGELRWDSQLMGQPQRSGGLMAWKQQESLARISELQSSIIVCYSWTMVSR